MSNTNNNGNSVTEKASKTKTTYCTSKKISYIYFMITL